MAASVHHGLLTSAVGIARRPENTRLPPTAPAIPLTTPHTSFLMSSTSLLRVAARAQPSILFRANGLHHVAARPSTTPFVAPSMTLAASSFSTTARQLSDAHHEETFEEFTARYALATLSQSSRRIDPRRTKFRSASIVLGRLVRDLKADRNTLETDTRRNSRVSTMFSSSRYDCDAWSRTNGSIQQTRG